MKRFRIIGCHLVEIHHQHPDGQRRNLFCTMLLALTVLTVGAQQRIPCVRNIPKDVVKTRNYIDDPIQNWDPQKIYRQAVVLISFADFDFRSDDPVAYYQRFFNEPGYNEGYGLGSVADYFRDQSGGLFNLQFDIYGPVKVTGNAKKSSNVNYGDDYMKEAMSELRSTVDADFSIYDWDEDGIVDQIIFIAAGYMGNQVKGYIWPNTGFLNLRAPGNIPVSVSSICCELWGDATTCGIGLICHEYSHCLGLPDIYPTVTGDFSVVDEWDLMDGGNYINKGWCPPNFSMMEKMTLGWATPTELTTATTVTGMKPVSEGGETFIIRNPGNENEFYLLENRRQTNWDYGIPGEGLAIFHVDYDERSWSFNAVNTQKNHYRYDLFHADNRNYRDWDPAEDGKDMSKYTMPDNMRNKYLSTSVYPYADSFVVNQSLTDDSSPQAILYNNNTNGEKLMSKPITNIQMASDGTISFDFMMEGTGIREVKSGEVKSEEWFDLQGRRLPSLPQAKGFYIVRKGKTVYKIKI